MSCRTLKWTFCVSHMLIHILYRKILKCSVITQYSSLLMLFVDRDHHGNNSNIVTLSILTFYRNDIWVWPWLLIWPWPWPLFNLCCSGFHEGQHCDHHSGHQLGHLHSTLPRHLLHCKSRSQPAWSSLNRILLKTSLIKFKPAWLY